MTKQSKFALSLVGAAVLLVAEHAPVAAATSNVRSSPAAHITTALTGCNPAPLPGLCVGRPATAQEEAAMIAAGKPGIETELGMTDAATCPAGQSCYQVGNPSRAMVGTDAGSFYGIRTDSPKAPRSGCYVFVHRDTSGWHYDNGRCISAVEQIPSAVDQVYSSSGCVNVRDTASLSGKVVYCLQGGTKVYVDDAPVYQSGHIWWHLTCLGWMAHDFLVIPIGATNRPATIPANVLCPSPPSPFQPMVTFSLDSGPARSNVVMVASGFPAGEYTQAYWASSPSHLLGTPGPSVDPQGHVEADTQDGGLPAGFQFRLASDEFCLDTTTNQPDVAKACAKYTIEGALTPSSPTPTTQATATPAPSAAPTASLVPFQQVVIGVASLGVLLIALSGVFWLRRRRR